MDDSGSRIAAVVIVNVVIGLIQWLVRRQIPALGKGGQFGIYVILLPMGFGLFGFELANWFSTLFVVGGLAQLLYSVKKLVAVPSHAGRKGES